MPSSAAMMEFPLFLLSVAFILTVLWRGEVDLAPVGVQPVLEETERRNLAAARYISGSRR